MPGNLIDYDRRDDAMAQACRAVGLDPADAELLRRGTNAVYRLRAVPVIVRVAPLHVHWEDIQRQVAVARWLAKDEIPAVRVVDVEQPIEAAGHLVTLWESVADGEANDLTQYGTAGELGEILRHLHASLPPDSLHLPVADPVARVEQQLERLGHLRDDDCQLLVDAYDQLRSLVPGLRFALPAGPLHGDASVGNLLRDRAGHAVLSDLDNFRWGPRESDLILTAMFYDRYGWHTEAEYRDFADAYGFDVREWDGYQVLADLRELSMVLWVAGNADTSEEAAAELQRRLATLRTGAGREAWRPL